MKEYGGSSDGDKEKAARLTQENFNGLAEYEERDETPFRFGSFTTMGELYIETGLSEINMKNYHRILSLDSAMAVYSSTKTEQNINGNILFHTLTVSWS